MRRVLRALLGSCWSLAGLACEGEPDTTGMGEVRITFDPTGFADGDAAIQLEPTGRVHIDGVRALSDGKVLLFGHAGLSEGIDAQAGRELDVYLRLAADGRADPTFGDEGVVLHEDRNGIRELLVRPDGRLIGISFREAAGGLKHTQAWQLDPDGTLDVGFGGDGFAVLDVSDLAGALVSTLAYDAALAPDGAVIVIGRPERDGEPGESLNFAARIDATGGIQERALVPSAQGGRDDLWAGVVVDPDGTTRVYGTAWDGASHCLAGQLTASLALDPTFAGGDYAKVASIESDCSGTIARRPDGRVVAGGAGGGLTMFDPAGDLDVTFGTAGYLDLDGYLAAIDTLGDGTMLAQVQVPLDQSPFSAAYVVHIGADGTLDADFGQNAGLGPRASGMAISTTGEAYAAEMALDGGTVHVRVLPVP